MIRRTHLGLVFAAALLAGCQTATPTASSGGAPGSSEMGAATPSAEPLPTLGPPPTPSPPDETTPVELDPTVLDFLPETIEGNPVTESVDEATQALGDEDVQKIASAVDAAVAVDAGHANLVYAWVVRLRPDKLTNDIFRQWRDSYDEGACTGGVVGRAEATIDDRTVYITTCTDGLRTYHLWLEDQGILISASAIGDGKFGELLMDNLRVQA